ncbi:MAG: aspartoacylase [Agarilytica sp.]
MPTLSTVAIIGGTHGNELTGVHLLDHWASSQDEIKRTSFNTECHLANPKARQAVRRYIDQDLNRQFGLATLNDHCLEGYEHNRAKALNTLLGPKENPRIDFVLDMHTTTANMGTTLVFNTDDPFVARMAFYIKQQMPEAILFSQPTDRLEDNFLTSIARFNGLLVEVGPIAQGLLNHHVYEQTRLTVLHALDYIEKSNLGEALDLPKTMEGYQFIKKVALPSNEQGDITAMVHPERQHKDYEPINSGDPLFITLDGKTISYTGNETVYGAFINEAAYYDQKIGLSLMKKIDIKA